MFTFVKFSLFIKNHNSVWFSKLRNYLLFVQEDIFIRKFVSDKLVDSGVSQVEIKRKLEFLEINIYAAKPSVIMGPSGNKLYDLRKQLNDILEREFYHRNITINVVEIVNPDADPRFLAEFVRQQLEKRVPFRRVIKTAILKAQKAGVKGIKIQIAGRLNGAEIARTEWVREGQVPLHTLKANIDYCNYRALLVFLVVILSNFIDIYIFFC